MAVKAVPERAWSLYREMFNTIHNTIQNRHKDSYASHDLEATLQKFKPDFISLLQNPARNIDNLNAVRQANHVGIPVQVADGSASSGTQLLSSDFITEALTISDLFELNEIASVELLLSGEAQQSYYPGLPRGLVAILLYYDAKVCMAHSLRTLLQTRSGRTWALPGLSSEVLNTVTKFTDELIAGGLVEKILGLLMSINVAKQIERLESPEVRALGPPRHRQQVVDLIHDIRRSLANCIFCLSAQSGLSCSDTLLLINFLSQEKSLEPDGTLTDVSLALTMALLYAVDVRILEQEDAEDLVQKLPIVREPRYVDLIHREVWSETAVWGLPGLQATLRFAWASTVHSLTQCLLPYNIDVADYSEYDEQLIDKALAADVFTFLRTAVISNSEFHREEYYLRKIHYMITDFIVQMPLKTKELRNSGDETARIIMAALAEGLTPAAHLRRDFEFMMMMVAELYSKDPLGLELALDFWCPVEPTTPCDISLSMGHAPAILTTLPQRQLSLHKFVVLAGDILLPPLYIPYINMLSGLANGTQCAHQCFKLLRTNGGTQFATISWDHFFTSLHQYFVSLRQEVPHADLQGFLNATQYHTHGAQMANMRVITPQEVDGLRAVLELIMTVAKQDESSRIAMCENQLWHPILTLVGLLTCAVPVKLKAAIFNVLAAFAKSPLISAAVWQSIEMAQVLQTVPSLSAARDGGGHGSGIQLELEEVESRNEEYPLLLSYLGLMNELINNPIPAGLGAGCRVPGFKPYLDFLCESVLFKFNSRAYKRMAEKWQVANAVLEILHKLLADHEVNEGDFIDEPYLDQLRSLDGVSSKPPGHTLLSYMTSDSSMLRTILHVIDEACRMFDRCVPFPGKSSLESASLYSLKIIEATLQKQESYLDGIRLTGATTIGARLEKLLLNVNPRSGRSDHLVNIAKFVSYNSALPRHSYSALHILTAACQSPMIQSKIVGLFTVNEELSSELLRGFVECLECEEMEDQTNSTDEFIEVDVSESQVRASLRQDVVWLLLSVVEQSAPNLAHFLLGFDVRKPISRTTLQDAGVMGCPRTCLHAILSALNRGVDTRQGPMCIQHAPVFTELAYRLIFVLCNGMETSAIVLRYLRTHNFLYRHLRHQPVTTAVDGKENNILMQQSWLLKAVSIELRVTSISRQRSHTHRLMQLLLDDVVSSSQGRSVLKPDGVLEPDYTQFEADYSILNASASRLHRTNFAAVAETRTRRKLLTILSLIDFNLPAPRPLELNVFNGPAVEQVIAKCEQLEKQSGTSLYDVKQLHRTLLRDCNNLPPSMAGQRSVILEEIDRICRCAVERNAYHVALSSRRQSFDAWRQIVEVLLTACPVDLLQGEARQNIIFEILQDLLDKVSKAEDVNELTFLVAGVVLTLMSHLSHMFHSADVARMLAASSTVSTASRDIDHFSQYIALLDDGRSLQALATDGAATDSSGTGSRAVYSASLQVVLRELLRNIIRCSGSPPRVRAYLYGALLYFLQIAQKPKPLNISLTVDACADICIDGEFERLSRDNMTTINSYGTNLMDIICRDACDGHDVGRMLALSTLDLLLVIDYQQLWFNHLSSRGYVQHIIDSLLQDDELLKKLLEPQPEPLRALYIFQSKISFLTRLAKMPATARILLDCSLTARLSQCSVFSCRPEAAVIGENFIPTVLARYRQQILFPVLRLLLALLTSFGSDNRLVAGQVLQFIVAHVDVFMSILRDRQLTPSIESLQELALTTAVISRAAAFDGADDWSVPETQATVGRLQRQLFALLGKYSVVGTPQHQHIIRTAAAGELASSNPVAAAAASNMAISPELDDIVTQMEMSIYEVVSNVISLCTQLVSKSDAEYAEKLSESNFQQQIAASGKSAKRFRILFEPTLFDCIPRDPAKLQDFISSISKSSVNPSCSPRLGIVLYLLNTSSQLFASTLTVYKQIQRKYTNLSDLTTDELKQLSSSSGLIDDTATTQKRSQVVGVRLGQSLHLRSQQLRQLSYIIENCMFLLWRHLEFYLVYCVPVDSRTSLYQLSARKQQMRCITGLPERDVSSIDDVDLSQSAGVTREQLEQLKLDVKANINDALLQRLKDMEECYTRGRTRHGFVSAVVRRLCRLVQLRTAAQ